MDVSFVHGEVRGREEEEKLTVEQVVQQDQDVLHDVLALRSRLEHALVARASDKQDVVGVEVGLDGLAADIALDLVDGADAGELVVGQGAGAHGAIPGNRALADAALQRREVRGGVQQHGGMAGGCSWWRVWMLGWDLGMAAGK